MPKSSKRAVKITWIQMSEGEEARLVVRELMMAAGRVMEAAVRDAKLIALGMPEGDSACIAEVLPMMAASIAADLIREAARKVAKSGLGGKGRVTVEKKAQRKGAK